MGFFDALYREPRPKFKALDRLVASIMMVVRTYQDDYRQQNRAAPGKPFRWSNRGALAENWAVLLDQLKAFHAWMRASDGRLPLVSTFFSIFFDWLIAKRGINVLKKTLEVKMKDWEKGGTRYTSDAGSNTIFADEEERLKKVDSFLAVALNEGGRVSSNAVAVAATVSSTTEDGDPVRAVQGPLSRHTGAAGRSGGGGLRGYITSDALNQQEAYLAELRALLSHSNRELVYPLDRLDAMPKFVDLCFRCPNTFPARYRTMRCLNASVPRVKAAFVQGGGLLAVQAWVRAVMEAKDEEALRHLLLYVARDFRDCVSHFSAAVQAAWLDGPNKTAQWIRSYAWTAGPAEVDALIGPLEAMLRRGARARSAGAAAPTNANNSKPAAAAPQPTAFRAALTGHADIMAQRLRERTQRLNFNREAPPVPSGAVPCYAAMMPKSDTPVDPWQLLGLAAE